MNDKKKYKVLLWDIDGTVLNFKAAEKEAIRMGFRNFGLGECTDEMIARYSVINDRYWRDMELGKTTKEALMVDRFAEWFAQEKLPADREMIRAFNSAYQLDLGETIVFNDGAKELLAGLRGKYLQYAATNGSKAAQTKKLARSGLDGILDGVFISEDVGFEKPRAEFFDAVFRTLPDYERSEFLMIGDSLTGDMRGGENAGIDTCWYNPADRPNTAGVRVDYEIRSLQEVPGILGNSRR